MKKPYVRFSADYNCDEVRPHFFISGYPAAIDIDFLTKLGVTHIFSVLNCGVRQFPGIAYKKITIEDTLSSDLYSHFPAACAWIDSALTTGGTVLVHCAAGISRSSTIVCAYLMFKENATPTAALRSLRQRHPRANPNSAFFQQLAKWRQHLLAARPPAPGAPAAPSLLATEGHPGLASAPSASASLLPFLKAVPPPPLTISSKTLVPPPPNPLAQQQLMQQSLASRFLAARQGLAPSPLSATMKTASAAGCRPARGLTPAPPSRGHAPPTRSLSQSRGPVPHPIASPTLGLHLLYNRVGGPGGAPASSRPHATTTAGQVVSRGGMRRSASEHGPLPAPAASSSARGPPHPPLPGGQFLLGRAATATAGAAKTASRPPLSGPIRTGRSVSSVATGAAPRRPPVARVPLKA
ncbi:putative dual specificity protein phosphatase 22-b [Paratrimastix pyriformis]|uniref:Dual specificity protein phosphatase 22-b n=1 Tax=Paratrimastix pyriformis TaxID=342808 RepID=A0ABQ8UKW9_9EUKA|nr:putative dual specificity protein phosphatase 22-b [Paratrimastix pyriformis]